ncbi:hypothetical protein COCVIDRAFT_87211 [Bipolaris victoriae FI3]|uniref:Uncharacterized protein n=2 Tax=Bipolaris TaxID=33194 RepID=W6YNW4_COCC2|nr:uncharacterized protein COCCADRAFT_96806 [Bipolaris zeicola 26-R-13]XP_014561220.1 hypothetical protein COCVIDRAFT_87211 [Bipolaris victoriae FI3]EUC33146.1 hypothetical protein COCCADRAFT_96806 [Bipolaris zeicola 26-R-13]
MRSCGSPSPPSSALVKIPCLAPSWTIPVTVLVARVLIYPSWLLQHPPSRSKPVEASQRLIISHDFQLEGHT